MKHPQKRHDPSKTSAYLSLDRLNLSACLRTTTFGLHSQHQSLHMATQTINCYEKNSPPHGLAFYSRCDTARLLHPGSWTQPQLCSQSSGCQWQFSCQSARSAVPHQILSGPYRFDPAAYITNNLVQVRIMSVTMCH